MYQWSHFTIITFNESNPFIDHPTFKDGEKLHVCHTWCGNYTIVRQDTCKVYLLFRGHLSDAVLQRKSLNADDLKKSV